MARELTYNNFSFPLDKTKVTVSARPVLDDNGRTTKHIEHTMSVESYVTPAETSSQGPTTKAQMERIRRQITKNGKELVFTDWGYGDLIVNSGAVRDVDWGPKVQTLAWTPVGSDYSCQVRWECVVAIPECTEAKYQFGISQFSYSVDWTTDERGLTTRVITGFLEIPQTRYNDSSVKDEPDLYRDKIRAELPLGFRRTHVFRRAPDGKRLDFTLTDTEIDSAHPLPAGVTHADVRHSVSSQGTGFVRWSAGIQGTVRVARNLHPLAGLEKMLPLIRDRVLRANRNGNGSLIVVSARFEEDVYANAFSFAIGYTFSSTLTQIILDSGLWRAPPGANWSDWRQSMEASTHHNRGHAKMRHNVGADVLVDLCENPAIPSMGNGGSGVQIPGGSFIQIGATEPTAEGSWLRFQNKLYAYSDSGAIVHAPLPDQSQSETINQLGPDAADEAGVKRSQGAAKLDDAQRPESKVQVSGNGQIYVEMSGVALRAKFGIEVPVLKMIGDQRPVELKRRVWPPEIVANFGVPVYRAAWNITYVLKRRPKGIVPVFGNPVIAKATTVSGF